MVRPLFPTVKIPDADDKLVPLGPEFSLKPEPCPPASMAATRAASRLVLQKERTRKLRTVTVRETDLARIISRLRSHIRPHDRVALATCGRNWDPESRFWLNRLPWSMATYKLRERTLLGKFIRRNVVDDVRTIVLIHSIGEHASECLKVFSVSSIFVYMVHWILLAPDEESINALSLHVSQTPFRNFSCELGGSKQIHRTKLTTPANVSPAVFSRGCVERLGKPLLGKHSELRNTVIRAACIDIPHFRRVKSKQSCNSYETDLIFDAMKHYNVSVVQTFYATAAPLAVDLFRGIVDVHRNLASANPAGMRDVHIPGAIGYWYESFYVKRNNLVLLSFSDILDDSKFGLTLVAVALFLTLLVLVLTNADRARSCSVDALASTFMFLLASFYSTSHSLPRIGRLTCLATLVCGLWMVAMLPFSNYFRSELTSLVTLRAFPDHMDTLAELERGLDEGRVVPCVVKDSFLHERVTSEEYIGNLHRKLRSAFQGYKHREKLVQLSYVQCLKCALTEGRICYAPSLPSWWRSPDKGKLVESREHMNFVLLTIGIRKNYPLLRGLQELIRKIMEGGLMRAPEEYLRAGHLQNYCEQTSYEMKPLKLAELSSFFYAFVTLLAATLAVFLTEIFIYRHKNAHANDVVEA
ncbi:hypothetical protein HPB50_008475 [Hyalomma asiaticum]|uniref:Uncharacterized protein n=1 Tax=Hyalomma asiaticum TaxID=266040 RepID=A0ACB7RT23_HYAAI|nr:hypothetical protein HPB50_008475 [Hyalomma asiaticum]